MKWLQEAAPAQILFVGVLVIAAVALVSSALGGDGQQETQERVAVEEQEEPEGPDWVDGSARAACQHHRNVIGDVADGVLTDAELREKLREVRSDAELSDAAGLEDAATEMLAAVTAGDTDRYLEAIDEMDAACSGAFR